MVFHGKSTINYFLRVIPTLNHYSDIVSDIPFGSVYMSYLFWHSIWQYLTFFLAYTLTFYLASILTYFWHIFWHSFWQSIWHLFWHSIWYLFRHSFWHMFWHPLWHSFWHMNLAYLLTFFLAFYLVYLWRFFVVEVRRGPLRSRACCSGPARTAAIKNLQLRSGADHFDPEAAVRVRRRSRRREAGGGRDSWHKT